jgi:ABC-2 type transport system permease protein
MEEFYRRLQAIAAMLKKEFLATLKDPASRVLLVVPCLVQGFLFGYAATYNLTEVPYALYDESKSVYSRSYVAHLEGSGIFKRVRTLSGSGQMAEPIDSGEAMAVVHISQDFADCISRGEPGTVQLITDGRNSVTSGLAQSYAASMAAAYSQELSGREPLLSIKTRTWYNPNEITQWMFLPSLIPMLAITQVLLLSGLSVARERENGTFDQLLVTPLHPMEILVGKAVPPICIGLFQASLMLLIALFWFQVPFSGSLVLLYMFILLFLVSCVGIGLTISALSATMQQVMVYNFATMMPMILLSGLATPVRNMPNWLQYFTYVNPFRFAIDAIRRIDLEGAPFSAIWFDCVPLIVVACITMPLAAWMFRHKLT